MKSMFPVLTRPALAAGALLLLTAGTQHLVSAQTPVFEARFNDATSMDLQSGATLGPGVSGMKDDQSYSANIDSMSDGQKGPAATSAEHNPVMGINEFTITVWYKPRQTLRNDATLFDVLGTMLIWEEKSNQWVLRVDTKPANDPKPSAYWFRPGNTPPMGNWASPDTWNFLAVVWKRSDKKAVFYQGGETTHVNVAKESPRSEEVEPLNERTEAKRVVGNNFGKAQNRPFDGNIDNVRIYTTALSDADIEKIRQADLKNKTPALP